jgi:hypothetical protein
MNELSRYGRELLNASRRERTPEPQRKQRLLEKLLTSAAQTSLAAREPPPLAQRLGTPEKLLVLLGLLLMIAAGMWLASR